MNNNIYPNGAAGERMNGYSYFIGISVAIVVLIAIIALASYFCNRVLTSQNQHRARSIGLQGDPPIADEQGLDEVTLQTYPTLLYPECGHFFHMKCVDPWLRLHPTCPVCRSSPMPTPLSTPLAEVVPLARQQIRSLA